MYLFLNFGVCVRAFWCHFFHVKLLVCFLFYFIVFFFKFPFCEIAWPSILLMAAPWFAQILVSSL